MLKRLWLGLAFSSTLSAAEPLPLPLASASLTPSPSFSATLTPSPSPEAAAVAATPTAIPAWSVPLVPGQPEGTFDLLTQSGKAGLPVVRLSWQASEPGDYLIKGYRVERRVPGSETWQLRLGEDMVPDDQAVDGVATGTAYEYSVIAVDIKGAHSQRSALLALDLRQLPEAVLAPRAPLNLTATAKRDSIILAWAAAPIWLRELSYYKVFRAESADGLGASLPATTSAAAFEDKPPEVKKTYAYAVAAVDTEGRISALSVTVSGRATGALPPSAPRALTARAKTEKVTLNWEAAEAGTSAVSGYRLKRREEGSDSWQELGLLPLTQTAFSDAVEGDRGYLYGLSAVDAEGGVSEPAYAGASPSAKAYNKSLILLMPTAYSDHRGRDDGFNLNVMFDYYVGSLYESYVHPVTNIQKTAAVQAIQVATITGDLKYALLNDRGLIPGLAAGFYGAALISFGQQTVGLSSSGGSISTLGNLYGVISKRFWPGEPRAAIHVGAMRGKIADYLTSDPTPADWRPTIRHLSPGGDVPSLLLRLVDPKQGALPYVKVAPHLAFMGIQFPAKVPFGFATWKTGLRLEVLTPFAPDEEKVDYGTHQKTYAELMPVMTNFHIENLPLGGFEFSVFQYQGGWQWIAFYHITDLTWSF